MTEPIETREPMPGESKAEPTTAPTVCRFTIGEALRSARATLDARADGTELPIATPWASIDGALGGGLLPGLHILVGNTGSGKTQWALQVALQAASAGKPVLYVGLELDPPGIIARLAAIRGRQDAAAPRWAWSELYTGRLHGDRLSAAHRAMGALETLPIHLEFAPPGGWGAAELSAAIAATRPDLAVIDYLQLAQGPDRELRERIGKLAYAARHAASTHRLAVIAVSSTARENYAALDGEGKEKLGAGSPARLVGLGKESGELEYAADSVLVLARDPWPSGQPPPSTVHVAVAKLRHGPTAWGKLEFDGSIFTEAT